MAEKGEQFNSGTRKLDGHKFTDMRTMRTGILGMCQDIGLGGRLSELPISREGFLEEKSENRPS